MITNPKTALEIAELELSDLSRQLDAIETLCCRDGAPQVPITYDNLWSLMHLIKGKVDFARGLLH